MMNEKELRERAAALLGMTDADAADALKYIVDETRRVGIEPFEYEKPVYCCEACGHKKFVTKTVGGRAPETVTALFEFTPFAEFFRARGKDIRNLLNRRLEERRAANNWKGGCAS